jgi:hypothetical protein
MHGPIGVAFPTPGTARIIFILVNPSHLLHRLEGS